MEEFALKKNSKLKAAVVFPHTAENSSTSRLDETTELAKAIDLDVIYKENIKLREIKPSTYVGKGVVDKIKTIAEELAIDLLIMDTSLSPIQQRNLEKELNLKVIDRTALILEIFGERAKTKEGILQVELAHLTYQRSRLVRSWTHLERQRGGAGFLGGPGETQIELDRRIIDEKIVKIKKELEKVKQTRGLQRSSRKKIPYPIAALVGYTNAGKSSLFNKLTKADVFAKDILFATLDPTLRRIKLKNKENIILSDTVGFISDLPHELVMSFRATLEEVLEADIIVHVRDVSNPEYHKQKQDVLKVLHHLGLKDIENKDNYIEVLNKIDLLNDDEKTQFIYSAKRRKNTICASALSGEGCEDILGLIAQKLSVAHKVIEIEVPATDGKKISWLHEYAEVVEAKLKNKTMLFKVKIDPISLEKFKKLS